MAQVPQWIDHLKAELLAGKTMNEANLSYYRQYFPDQLARTEVIVDMALEAAAMTVTPPPAECNFPYVGIEASKQLVLDVLFSRL